jgi:DnaJ-class molecular chaperone
MDKPKIVCGACNGSGRMPRDPDIGTDQECFVCDGTGEVDESLGVCRCGICAECNWARSHEE